MRIAVVEDDPVYRKQITDYLEQYRQEREVELEIIGYRDGTEIVDSWRGSFDMILMDIQMRDMDGMTAAAELRRRDPDVILIFITNMAQYALDGYAVDALDYLLKPVSYFALSQRLDRGRERLERLGRNRTASLAVPVKGGTRKIGVRSIRYVESRGHTILVHTGREELSMSGTMAEMERQLAGYGFVRCNKGYLVNLEHVDAVRDGCVVIGREQLVISRGRRAAFLKQLADYLGELTQ